MVVRSFRRKILRIHMVLRQPLRDLRKNCVAHVNLDLTGCKNSEQVVARTAGSEGISYTADLIESIRERDRMCIFR